MNPELMVMFRTIDSLQESGSNIHKHVPHRATLYRSSKRRSHCSGSLKPLWSWYKWRAYILHADHTNTVYVKKHVYMIIYVFSICILNTMKSCHYTIPHTPPRMYVSHLKMIEDAWRCFRAEVQSTPKSLRATCWSWRYDGWQWLIAVEMDDNDGCNTW